MAVVCTTAKDSTRCFTPVGAVLALAGAIVLVVLAASQGDPWKMVGVSIYGVTMVVMYCSSILYHSVRGRAKDFLRKMDHQSIYLQLAGSAAHFVAILKFVV